MTAARSINLGVLISVSDQRYISLTAVSHAGGVPQATVRASPETSARSAFGRIEHVERVDCVYADIRFVKRRDAPRIEPPSALASLGGYVATSAIVVRPVCRGCEND